MAMLVALVEKRRNVDSFATVHTYSTVRFLSYQQGKEPEIYTDLDFDIAKNLLAVRPCIT